MKEETATDGPDRHRTFSPYLDPQQRAALNELLSTRAATPTTFTDEFRSLARRWSHDPESAHLRAICLLVADLFDQGWEVRLEQERVIFEPPGLTRNDQETIEDVKERIRRTLRIGRDRQLQEPSVKRFLGRMERPFPRIEGAKTSIRDLVDDGTDLARELGEVLKLDEADRPAALRKVVDPVIEVCGGGAKCTETGLDLIDIWRYFRHTWMHEYRSIPGRQLLFLVRNAARPKKPVMGIAMLASPVMRLTARDNWIGWLRPAAYDNLVRENGWEPAAFAHALLDRLEASIADVRWEDLASAEEIAAPKETVALRLQQRAAGAAFHREQELRRHYDEARTKGEAVKSHRGQVKAASPDTDWIVASEDLLFVRKRAETLGALLFAKHVFKEAGLATDPEGALTKLFFDTRGQRAIDIVMTEFRKAGLSSRIADVSICGAIHPYNELLAGKLVTLLLTSSEVRKWYAERYGHQVSVIASQMAGRPIEKPSDLAILTTTSLYGVGSSQYNRLALRAREYPTLPFDIRWEAIERSLTGGWGTLHLSSDTAAALRELSEARHDARRVNNRFGEGTSPRLRQIREGLETLGMRSDHVLNHATPRIFYGCELAPGVRPALLGLGSTTTAAPDIAAISDAWRRRWVLGRIERQETLKRLGHLGPHSIWASLHADADGQMELPLEVPDV